MHPMMLNKLKNLFFMTEVKDSHKTPTKQDIKQVVNDVLLVPRYPPFDNGVPVIAIDRLVETQSELINRIRAAFGYSPAQFESMVMSVIRNYAAYVHLLPATNREHHNNAGGLFRLGLEVGFYALQAADGKIFSSKETAELRRALHPKWVYATFVAGLCSEMHLPYTTMTVMSREGKKWPSLSKPLYDWAVEMDSGNYYIHWTDNIITGNQSWQASPIYVLNMVLPSQARDYLNDGNEIIFSSMMNSIGGMSRHSDGNLIGELVRHYKDMIIDKDIKANPSFYGKLTVGSHLAPNVIDIMRELIKEGVWTVNTKNSRIWYTKEGCFVVWGAAFAEITSVMKKRDIPGTPSNSETLAELLLNSNLIEAQHNGSAYWQINIPNTARLADTVKIVDPTLLFDKSEVAIEDYNLFAQATPQVEKAVSNPQVNNTVKPVAEVNQEIKKPVQEAKKPIQEAVSTDDKAQPNTLPSVKTNKNPENNSVSVQKQNVENNNVLVDKADNKVQKTTESKPVTEQKKSAVDSKILDQVSIETKRLFNAIRSDMEAGVSEHPVWMNAKGLVISRAEFESHGIPYIKVFDELKANNWLVLDPETKKYIYRTVKDGAQVEAYLINKSIALSIGFKDSNA